MLHLLEQGLHSRSGVVRKGCAFALQAPKRLVRARVNLADFAARPPILVNSFPKSGTHLLDQIVGAIPNCRNYGEFISSMTSSYRYQRRTAAESCRILDATTPGELVRAHLFYSEEVVGKLRNLQFVHLFIYRDLRDVAVSEAHYYRSINRWHRLHPLFRDAPSVNDAIMMAITGVDSPSGEFYFPNIGERFAHYLPWIDSPDVFAVRFEDITSESRMEKIREMMGFYASRAGVATNVDELCQLAVAAIAPDKSHTYRSGKTGGWRDAFTDEHREAFKRFAGAQLAASGYESEDNW